MATRTEIEAAASRLLREAGVEDQLPVPLEQIASNLGFESVGFSPNTAETGKISGLIDYTQKKIMVNTSESLARQRFTLAHEIGHAVLHASKGSIVDYRADMDNPSSDREREANQFAAALLMPREKFIPMWVRTKGDKEILTKFFGVSGQALDIRTANTVNAAL